MHLLVSSLFRRAEAVVHRAPTLATRTCALRVPFEATYDGPEWGHWDVQTHASEGCH